MLEICARHSLSALSMINATMGTPCNITLRTSLFLIFDPLLLLELTELFVLLLLMLPLLLVPPPLDAMDDDELDDCECKYD